MIRYGGARARFRWRVSALLCKFNQYPCLFNEISEKTEPPLEISDPILQNNDNVWIDDSVSELSMPPGRKEYFLLNFKHILHLM